MADAAVVRRRRHTRAAACRAGRARAAAVPVCGHGVPPRATGWIARHLAPKAAKRKRQ